MEDDSSSSIGDSKGSKESSSSASDMVDDASSLPSCSSTDSNSGPLYELSELMAELPIKRGLSKYFQGKSQSFTSLSRVKSIKDLAKKETPLRKKMKACKSYGFGLDSHKLYTLPRAKISKKESRGSLSLQGRRSAVCFPSSRSPPTPVQKNFRSINSLGLHN
ncbi:hypothetical protein SLEP1_g44714 [Rubroshorea leprosula]|uniref:Oxidative stress 3 n=1 Tax=Rubroshorea leprosula TaxID=152421 RepID=A0AAV5LHE0_9ROSI|nr:hypothetical protein SLEP1_g44714 [Rubroshorea leprosula]